LTKPIDAGHKELIHLRAKRESSTSRWIVEGLAAVEQSPKGLEKDV
jgi:hypothetical protein